MSSGYPSAEQLRLLMTSRLALRDKLEQHCPELSEKERPSIRHGIWDRMQKTEAQAIQLFRNGGFASVDEFSKLAQKGKYAKFVPALKSLMRIALALHNPEIRFHESDYYPFLQSLFQADEARLREDITILSFNYDTYLEYLLARAYSVRRDVDQARLDAHDQAINAVYSGFQNIDDKGWTGLKFKVLKLHGSIAFPESRAGIAEEFDTEMLFSLPQPNKPLRIVAAMRLDHTKSIPPVVFPWELFKEDTVEFKKMEDFCLNHPDDWPKQRLYFLLRDVWTQAQEAVQRADKISLIGLSGHSYLKQGFRFLLNGRNDEFHGFVANPENGDERRIYSDKASGRYREDCAIGRLDRFFRELTGSKKASIFSPSPSFRDFILRGI